MYKLFSTLFSFLLTTAVSYNAFSCGWYMPDESLRFSLLNAELFQDKAHRPLYYTINFNGYNAEMLSKDERLLAQEWKTELKLKSSVDEIRTYFFGGLSPEKLKLHSFSKEIEASVQLKQFLTFAKSCEFNVSALDPWSDTDFIVRQNKLPQLIFEGENLLRNEKSTFWKKKYAFQLLRLSFYNNEPFKFHFYYEAWFGAGKEKTTIDWWATHYYSEWISKQIAGMKPNWIIKHQHQFPKSLLKNGSIDNTEAIAYSNYLHAMVLRHSSNKAYISKHLYSANHFDKQLRFAKNQNEIADLFVIKHLNNPFIDLKTLDSIIKFDENHPLLKLVLTRELNKFEELEGEKKYFVYTHGFRYFYTSYNDDFNKSQQKLPPLMAFKKRIQKLNTWKKSNSDQYHLLLTHLNILDRNFSQAKLSLAHVLSEEKDVLFQKSVYAACIVASDENLSLVKTQNEIAGHLFYLINNRDGVYESDRVMFSLCSYLSKVFESKKIHHFAGIFSYFAKTKFTVDGTVYSPFDYFDEKTSITGAEKMIAIFNTKNPSKLEQFCMLPFENDYDFRILLSRLYLRTNQTHNAWKIIKDIPDNFWHFNLGHFEVLQSDPFALIVVPNRKSSGFFNNSYDSEMQRLEMLPKFTRKQIMKDLDSIEISAKKGNTGDLLKLGNAWFNFSANAKNWQVISYFNAFNRGPHLTRLVKLCQEKSLRYYQSFLQKKQDRESEAHAKYMIALIYQQRGEAKSYQKAALEYEQLNKTNFYQGINCSYTKRGKFDL